MSPDETDSSVDLGGSSKYSDEILRRLKWRKVDSIYGTGAFDSHSVVASLALALITTGVRQEMQIAGTARTARYQVALTQLLQAMAHRQHDAVR